MEKIKVLHIITSLNIGGAERLVTDIALNNPRNITVTSLKYTNSHYLSELYEAEVRYNYLTKGSVYNPLLILKIIPLLKKYKIVHIHLFPTIYWVVFAKILSFSNVKLIYTEHNTDNRRRKYLIFQKLDQFIYSKLDIVDCISKKTEENLKKHLTERFNVPIETILNGVNLKKFSIKETDSADYNYFKPNDFILIQISSFRKQKDQITLIKCLKFLPENIKLLL